MTRSQLDRPAIGVSVPRIPAKGAALPDHEGLFALAMANAPIGMCVVSPDGHLLAVNQAMCDFFGRPMDELVGCTWQQLTHPEDLAGDLALAAEVLAGGRDGYRLSKRYLHVDGSVRYGDLSVSAVRSPDGELRFFIGQIVDHTARAAAQAELAVERALAASQEQLRLLLDNATDVVLRADTEGVIDWVTPSAKRALGWQPLELIGRSIHDLLGSVPANLLHEQRDPRDDDLALGDATARFETEVRTAAKGRRWFAVNMTRVRAQPGNRGFVVVALRDIQDEHAAKLARDESDRRYRMIAANTYDVIVHSRQGEILWVSPSLTTEMGWEPQEWVNHRIEEFLEPADRDRLGTTRSSSGDGQALRAALNRFIGERSMQVRPDGSVVSRFRLRAKDGTYHWVETHVRVLDSSGGYEGVVTSFRTVDREVSQEQELRYRATRDELTCLLKRNAALAELEGIVHQRRRPGSLVAVIFADVDDFKLINDSHGHANGDLWLQVTASRIRATVRQSDTVARIGGDEFLVILKGLHGIEEARAVAEKIRLTASQPVAGQDAQLVATLSLGVTLVDGCEGVDCLLQRADRAMYAAKRTGRNRVVSLGAE